MGDGAPEDTEREQEPHKKATIRKRDVLKEQQLKKNELQSKERAAGRKQKSTLKREHSADQAAGGKASSAAARLAATRAEKKAKRNAKVKAVQRWRGGANKGLCVVRTDTGAPTNILPEHSTLCSAVKKLRRDFESTISIPCCTLASPTRDMLASLTSSRGLVR